MSEPESVETRVLEAINQAAATAQAPVAKAVKDAFKAKWYSVVAVAGLVLSLLATVGVAKALHDSRHASVVYRDEACQRGNAYRAADLVKWKGLLALATKADPKDPPKLPSVIKRDAARLQVFLAFLESADLPVDCAALARKPN